MKYAIAGSRTVHDEALIYRLLDYHRKNISEIITGGAIGVDKIAEKWAKERGVRCTIIRPTNPAIKYDYLKRNEKIVENADCLIAFWDGKSKGTYYTINYAKKIGKKCEYHLIHKLNG